MPLSGKPHSHIYLCFIGVLFLSWPALSLPALQSHAQTPLFQSNLGDSNRNISVLLFNELEELSRIVDIAYCVGSTGIEPPFVCASRCHEFKGFELVTTWDTGPLLSDSCGYLVLSHPPSSPRIIVAFRGTYSVSNTIADLSTVPQEYVPYPSEDGDDDDDDDDADSDQEPPVSPQGSLPSALPYPLKPPHKQSPLSNRTSKCPNCTVHSGFLASWHNTRPHILPHLKRLVALYPDYTLVLVGHSLGGAVAALGSLDMHTRGWNPHVTTFGEPRVGNQALVEFIDAKFARPPSLERDGNERGDVQTSFSSYRRVTHVDDPVPLLPLKEWGYRMHAEELYITKAQLSPSVSDLRRCKGDEDPTCIAGADEPSAKGSDGIAEEKELPSLPARYKLHQLFFAHRDYFWRLGLCIPGGDPHDWWREYPHEEMDEL
ncbi:MAG: hypothetical protein M1819_002272 [Sarea resinae]|nr:MAG: hypothetical protein M1819_002272 [Sarea resinae]